MIKIARRTAYFDKNPEIYWMHLQSHMTYKTIKFINWVYEVNGKVYTHCTKEFKEEFNKAKMWETLSE